MRKTNSIFTFISLIIVFLTGTSFSAIAHTSLSDIKETIRISNEDLKNYHKAFVAIRKSDYSTSQKLIKKIDNKILLGHILAETYLSDRYKTTPLELENWLKTYKDLPQKYRISRLAHRKNKNIKTVPQPKEEQEEIKIHQFQKGFSLSPRSRQKITREIRNFNKQLQRGKTKRARLILEKRLIQNSLAPSYYAQLALRLSIQYSKDNEHQLALDWAQLSSRKHKTASAHWFAGLSAWRIKHYITASSEFRRVASASQDDDWISSAGDFWAARAYQKRGHKKNYKKWMTKASYYQQTFYGILANKILKTPPQYNWEKISYYNDYEDNKILKGLSQNKILQRTVVLMLIKEEELANQEISANRKFFSNIEKESLLYLASYAKLPSTGIRLSQQLTNKQNNISYLHADYPLPQWKPQSGWMIDKSFLWAVARQESSFQYYISSPAGACGLMQLLPRTAAYISHNPHLRWNKNRLFNPEYNLELGQKYMVYLANKPFIQGNILYLLTAYNAGPGNLYKWQKDLKEITDPLLYMEIIPSRETRIYIEKVLSNYWIYQQRQGEKASSLSALAQGQWPILENDQYK